MDKAPKILIFQSFSTPLLFSHMCRAILRGMKAVYTLTGLVLITIIGAAFYFTSYNGNGASEGAEGSMRITSPVFEQNTSIPAKYTCDADNISPPLTISGIPAGTVSLVLLMDDPDVPKILKPDGVFDHWVLYGISVAAGQTSVEIPERAAVGLQGLNSAGKEGYTGPCPPPDFEPTEHRYFFKAYALSTELSFFKSPSKTEVQAAIDGNVIEEAELIGRYSRK